MNQLLSNQASAAEPWEDQQLYADEEIEEYRALASEGWPGGYPDEFIPPDAFEDTEPEESEDDD